MAQPNDEADIRDVVGNKCQQSPEPGVSDVENPRANRSQNATTAPKTVATARYWRGHGRTGQMPRRAPAVHRDASQLGGEVSRIDNCEEQQHDEKKDVAQYASKPAEQARRNAQPVGFGLSSTRQVTGASPG